jgi:hypothetical protein
MKTKNESKAVGGRARSVVLSPAQRSEIASTAAKERWAKERNIESLNLPKAIFRGTLDLAGIEIPCAVIDGARGVQRVLTESGITEALLGSRSGASKRLKKASFEEGDHVPLFLAPGQLKQFLPQDLASEALLPIQYRDGNRVIRGYDASILPTVCDIWLKAREAGSLQEQQLEKAQKAELLMRGLAHVGIVALVDEATGYQRVRAKNDLAKILEAFIAKELQPWIKTFPDDFYDHLFRLRKLEYPRDTVKKPQYFGTLTNDIVYKRLAPGVLDELRRLAERGPNGRPKHQYFRRLTENMGQIKLREHLASVVTLMKLSQDYSQFLRYLDQVHPRYGATAQLLLGDSGMGL